jgi:iron complex transport system substrate-binding protein
MSSDFTPRRVVSLQPSASLILAAIGKLERLVACTKYCVELCPELAALGKTVVSDSWTAKAAEIAAARPDLVIASVPYQEQAVIEILRSGVPFLGFAPKSLTDVYSDIAAIAGIMGVARRGHRVILDMQNEIDSVRTRAQPAKRRRVFCEEWGKPIIASQTWVSELVDAAGGEFIGTPGKQTTAEAVLAEDPDVMIAAWCGAGDRVPLQKIIRDRNWQNMRAVKQGDVYCVRDEFLNTPAPTLVRGLYALAAAIQPAIFPHPSGLRRVTAAISGVAEQTRPVR